MDRPEIEKLKEMPNYMFFGHWVRDLCDYALLLEKSLDIACVNLFSVGEDESCPAEYYENIFPACEDCAGTEEPCGVNILNCWKRYFIQKAGEADGS